MESKTEIITLIVECIIILGIIAFVLCIVYCNKICKTDKQCPPNQQCKNGKCVDKPSLPPPPANLKSSWIM